MVPSPLSVYVVVTLVLKLVLVFDDVTFGGVEELPPLLPQPATVRATNRTASKNPVFPLIEISPFI
jgi:hypothetical protein